MAIHTTTRDRTATPSTPNRHLRGDARDPTYQAYVLLRAAFVAAPILFVGPVIPIAERAISSSDAAELADFLSSAVRDEVHLRFAELMAAKARQGDGVGPARRYVTAMLGLEVWSHKLYGAIQAAAHESGEHHHG